MNLDGNSLLLSLLVSGIGFVLFEYGRRQVRAPQIVFGLALMIFPYFVSNIAAMAGVGAALVGACILVVRLGW
jgi:hypothetical protein